MNLFISLDHIASRPNFEASASWKRNMAAGGVTVVLGGQWGDEGKGKLVDLLAMDADLVCRCQVSV